LAGGALSRTTLIFITVRPSQRMINNKNATRPTCWSRTIRGVIQRVAFITGEVSVLKIP
jgi:hypothetical protein